jgi:glyoxylase-like metal-dependent hydrolase (beta-lactamase superfamily II)
VLLVEGEQRILIDTGVGVHDPGNPGLLPARLMEMGLDATAIDAVVLSHADFDHIGGATDGREMTFARAPHSIMRAEVEFWRQRPERLVPSPLYDEAFRARVNAVPPVAINVLGDRLRLVEDGAQILPGITMKAAPGHTPGNSIVLIESDGEVLWFVADLFYQPENITVEDWVSQYDYDPERVVETRRRSLDEAAASEALLIAYHLPFPGLGRVVRNRNGWQWIPA